MDPSDGFKAALLAVRHASACVRQLGPTYKWQGGVALQGAVATLIGLMVRREIRL